MNMPEYETVDLKEALRSIRFPGGFLTAYNLVECLAVSRGVETFLAAKKDTQSLYVVKCYDLRVRPIVYEHEILKEAHSGGLPAFTDEYRDEDTLCVVREYVPGRTLDQYAEENQLSESDVINLCVQLCDILAFLHGLQPPVIHRDIKPQNIIVRENGTIALIDFDIARRVDDEAESDTVFAGTRRFAPPEQYGFSQTDARADIYSLGVLLCWLLTGKTDVKHANIKNGKLAHIVSGCAAFSPDDRFTHAHQVKKALLRASESRRKPVVRRLISAVGIFVCLCTGFVFGRYTNILPFPCVTQKIQFREPLIEQAVRLQLGVNADAELSQSDLSSVRCIYIFGNETSLTQEAFRDGLSKERAFTPRGSIASVEDLLLLPNLEDVMIAYQNLSDIGAVASLRHLHTLNLMHTRVSDLSPLEDLALLTSLNVFDTSITSASVLDACKNLRYLNVGKTLISSLNDVGGAGSLLELSLTSLHLTDLSPIVNFTALLSLEMKGSTIADVAALPNAPALQTVIADESLRMQLAQIAEYAAFQTICE